MRKPETGRGALVELVVIVVAAVGLALLVQAFLVKPYRIPSPSMEPTLDVGQRVLANRIEFRLGGEPEIGDVVVFHPPVTAEQGYEPPPCPVEKAEGQVCPESADERSDETFVKRVVAGPGDSLRIDDGIPIVDGEPVTGNWEIEPCGSTGSCDFPRPITIPPDHWFMMGDNRGESADSRFWGPVPSDWLIGQAVFTYWPPDRIGFL
jgi:signal peptidase I